MIDELSDKVRSQIEEILSKFPEQRDFALMQLRDKVLERLRERLPWVLIALAIGLILSPVDEELDIVERLPERFHHVLTALIIEVIHEELDKLGRSKPCKHCLPDSEFCLRGKEWGSVCLNCEDYEPMEEE